MKKVANILIIIGAVLGIISLLGVLIGAGFTGVISGGAYKDLITQGIENGEINVGSGATTEEKYQYLVSVFKILMIVLIIIAVFIAISVVIAFVSIKKGKVGLHIANIVLGLFAGNIFILIGGVLGIVAASENPYSENRVQ